MASETTLSWSVTNDALRRVLIISPHPDDESLGAGGLIADAVRGGSQVKVVVMTKGDGFTWGVRRHFMAPLPGSRHYQSYGEHRRGETLEAARRLGLSDEDVVFFGYPDRGLAAIWEGYWSCGAGTYRSPFTRVSASPYAGTLTENAPYCGEAVIEDLRRVMRDFQPTLVIYPHPNDAHIDHWAAHNFTVYAIETLVEEGLTRPERWVYLVHRGKWPDPKGLRPGRVLSPPKALEQVDQGFVRFLLSTEAIEAKHQAILAHHSQITLLRNYMLSFVATNELFSVRQPLSLGVGRPVELGEASIDEFAWDVDQSEVIENPERDTVKRRLGGAADIVSLGVRQTPTHYVFLLNLRTNASRNVIYDVWINAFRPRTEGDADRQFRLSYSPPGPVRVEDSRRRTRAAEAVTRVRVTEDGDIEFQVPRTALGDPEFLFVGARTRALRMTIDWTAWRLIRTEDASLRASALVR